jgi:UV excision repair protein RAD23
MADTLLVKTVAGREIRVDCAPTDTVLSVKQRVLLTGGPEFPIERQKLIYNGKVLQDTQLLSECSISTFMVVMVSKPVPVSNIPAPPSGAASAVALPPVPPPVAPPAVAAAAAGVEVLEALRHDPMFPQLQATVQQRPEALGQIIQLLAQTNPLLIDAINANQQRFLEILNEPSADGFQGAGPYHDEHWGDDDDDDDDDDEDYMDGEDGGDGVANDMELLRLFATVNAEERLMLAATMGIPQERFVELQAMLEALPPEDLQALLESDAGAVADVDMASFTPAEQESITRLTTMGFTQPEVVNAFLACGRNEEHAINYLLDGGSGDYDDDDDDYA